MKVSETPIETQSVRGFQHYDNSINREGSTVGASDVRVKCLTQGLVMQNPPKIKLDAVIGISEQVTRLEPPVELIGDCGVPTISTEDATASLTNQHTVPLKF